MSPETTRPSAQERRIPAQRSVPVDAAEAHQAAVVVGVDGSERSVLALAWALRHAVEEDLEVLVVTAWPLGRRPFVHEAPGHFNEARWEARETQARAIAQARSLVQDAPRIDAVLVNAPMLEAILALCSPDRLVVLGTDRTDADSSPTGDSLTERAQRAARGPVLLVPAPPRRR